MKQTIRAGVLEQAQRMLSPLFLICPDLVDRSARRSTSLVGSVSYPTARHETIGTPEHLLARDR